MWLKIVIVVLFISLVISLFSGLFFLIQDKGKTMRTLQSLRVRLILASLLMGLVSYGFYSGKLGSKAPWDQHYLKSGSATEKTQSPQK
jgi:succinate dehydrogenase/fumarate reductase cytochrome b subunit